MSEDRDAPRLVVIDACVLINLAHVSRLDLLGRFDQLELIAPTEVYEEVARPEQRSALEESIGNGHLEVVPVEGPDALATFAELRKIMGAADAACIALTQAKDSLLATDDKVVRRETCRTCGPGKIITTPGLLLLAIRNRILTARQADSIKKELEGHNFVMAFDSFRDLLNE